MTEKEQKTKDEAAVCVNALVIRFVPLFLVPYEEVGILLS